MYLVRRQGKTIESFHLFVDAWLYVSLCSTCFCTIIGPDGQWKINPPFTN
jgi:hypothetical protein